MGRNLFQVVVAVLFLACGFWALRAPRPATREDAAQPAAPAPSAPPAASSRLPEAVRSTVAETPSAPTPEVAREAAYAVIDAAAVGYDAAAVVVIAPFLENADPGIRRMALDGLLRAGDASGAKALREAAKKLADPREAAEWLDAADNLELPPATLRKKRAAPAP